jgi:hypothetical protein
VAWSQAWVTANTELFTTGLSAWFFALSGSMTLLLTLVGTTLQSPSADLAAANLVQPTWLVLEYALTTQARLGRQKSTLGTWLVVSVASVIQLRMAAVLGSLALEATWWRLRAAGQRGL